MRSLRRTKWFSLAVGLCGLALCLLACAPEEKPGEVPDPVAESSPAQTEAPRLGENGALSGTLKVNEQTAIWIEAEAGEWIDLRLEVSDTTDAELELQSPEGDRLIHVDGAWDGDAERLVYGPLEKADYRLLVTASERLSFELTLAFHDDPSPRQRAWSAIQLQRFRGRGDTDALQRVATSWMDIDEPLRAIPAWLDAAKIFQREGQLELALNLFTLSLEELEKLENEKANWRSATFNRRGLTYRRLSQPELAEADFRMAEEIASESFSLSPLAAAINNRAMLRQDAGRFDEAQQLYEQAIELLGEPEVVFLKKEQGQYFENLSRLQTIQDRPAEAAQNLERALELYLSAGEASDSLRVQRVQSERAWQLFLAGDRDRALSVLSPVIAFFEDEERTSMSALVAWQRLGFMLEANGDMPGAVQAHRRAEEIALGSRFRDAVGLGITWCRLAATQQGAGDDAEADLEEKCVLGLEALRAAGKPNLLVSGLYWRAHGLARLGALMPALELLEEAALLLESLRGSVFGASSRGQFFESRGEVLLLQVEVLTRLYEQSDDSEFALRALATSDLLRARVAQDLLGLDASGRSVGKPAKEMADLDQLIATREKKLAGDPWQPEDAKFDRDIELESLLTRIETHEMRSLGVDAIRPAVDIEGIQSLLGADTAVFSLLTGEPRTFLWLLTGERNEAWSLDSKKGLERLARHFLEQLENGDPDGILSLGSRLAEKLFGTGYERLEGLEGKRLVFIGDGAFQQLPISALPSLRTDDHRFLAEDFEVVHAPSLATLARSRVINRQSPERQMALLGDPVYNMEAPSVGHVDPLTTAELEHHFPTQKPEERVGKLLYAALEIEMLGQLFDRPLVLTGPDASPERARSAELEDFALVHIASHGWRDPDFPMLSAFLLSEFDMQGNPVDGRLRLRDIYQLGWRAEMVVASACQTGVGGDLELASAGGLARGFISIGVPRIVVSQWNVDSEATAYFMQSFYRSLIEERLPPGKALQRARLDLLHPSGETPKRWQSPRFWAAFVFVGDWRAFELPTPDEL